MALSLQRYTQSNLDSSPLFRILKERIQNEREKSMVIEIKSKDFLNDNLIIEILSWLPVKALLQFRSVCKSWYAIISSPNFISRHLKNYYENSDSDCLLAQCIVNDTELRMFELLVDETETPQILAHEGLYKLPMGAYIGPCDGLYHLYFNVPIERALWNPALNEYKRLPPIITKPSLPSNFTHDSFEVHGLGYDPLTDDYKVVVIKGYSSDTDDDNDDDVVSEIAHPQSVFVYSLKTDAWRYCGDLAQDYILVMSPCYPYMNGCYYWLGSPVNYTDPIVIISFDMSTDIFEEMNGPNLDQPAYDTLGIYDNSLTFLSVHENEKQFNIWTLNEGLWTKKFTLGPLMGALTYVKSPVGYWKNNKVILDCKDFQLIAYDPKTQEINDLVLISRNTSCIGVLIYKESLVSINDKNRWGNHQETEGDAL